jgi:hypothetical protein
MDCLNQTMEQIEQQQQRHTRQRQLQLHQQKLKGTEEGILDVYAKVADVCVVEHIEGNLLLIQI